MTKPKETSSSSIDKYIALKIRQRRRMLGLTQVAFADLLDVSQQQIYKYEAGVNRLSAGKLFEIARELRTPLEYFYPGFQNDGLPESCARERLLLEATWHFSQIPAEAHQKALTHLIRVLAGGSAGNSANRTESESNSTQRAFGESRIPK